jgi:hypothetical protein
MGGAHQRRREAGAAGTEGGGSDAGGQLGADTGGGAALGLQTRGLMERLLLGVPELLEDSASLVGVLAQRIEAAADGDSAAPAARRERVGREAGRQLGRAGARARSFIGAGGAWRAAHARRGAVRRPGHGRPGRNRGWAQMGLAWAWSGSAAGPGGDGSGLRARPVREGKVFFLNTFQCISNS